MRHRILVVEDDPSVQEVYQLFFETHHEEFFLVLAKDGERAVQVLQKYPRPPVDIVLLDWTLPGAMDGIQVLRFIRSNLPTRHVPVFLVTAHETEGERVLGLESGADDYLTKPICEKELLARMRGVLRRKEWSLEDHQAFAIEDLRLDSVSRQVTIGHQLVDLSATEFALLLIFLKRPNIIHGQEYLWEAIWCYKSRTWNEILRAHIKNLRKKLPAKWSDRLETHRNLGYLFNTHPLVPQD